MLLNFFYFLTVNNLQLMKKNIHINQLSYSSRIVFSMILMNAFFILGINAQSTITGTIKDKETGEELIGATVKIKGTSIGCVTDIDGNFLLKTDLSLPLDLEISYMGYQQYKITVTSSQEKLKIKLINSSTELETIEVSSGISEKIKESPLTIETMSINGIKETPATNFYEGLSHLKGVDLTSASLGFRVVNTRGFNSTSPVRSLQIIDGVDNASPGLNFALGNFLGASELDLMKVEIVSGASSAFYGPNAFNGVISMHTKNPFLFPGFSANVKLGERGLNEYAIRYAQVFKNKEGKDKFAYKLNLFYMNAYDWVANNSNAVADLDTDESNPGGYDAVNRYGDENLSPTINNSLTGLTGEIDSAGLWKRPGLKRWHRTGYWEEDIVDYDTENFKAALALHYLVNEDIELIASSNFGTGTTVYQGDNRFSLKDILFFQNRIELKKQDDFFIRAYATHEDAGNSYDAVLTAFLMQDAAASDVQWSSIYSEYWWDNIVDKVRDLDPSINWTPYYDPNTNPPNNPPDYALMELVYAEYQDSLIAWHNEAAAFANSAYVPEGTLDFFQPGTARFDSLLQDVTSKTSFLEGGSRIQDQSALYHFHAEKKFKPDFATFTIGMNGRIYRPRSEGSLFSDTNGVVILNKEVGFYGGMEKKMLDDKLLLKTTLRIDKNQNFQLLPSPALSFIYQPNENHTIRTTFTSAIRNPTLLNQYMYYNVGRALLVGNISGYDSLATPESLLDYLTSGSNRDINLLNYFNLDPIRPEKVKCVELGYRGTFFNKLYVDASYYYNWYKDFIGFKNGIDFWIDPLGNPRGIQAYRIATNSTEQITTQGFAIGLNYYIGKYFALNGNYSWNKLNKESEDPIIPAYNTPEHKFNIGISGREVVIDALKIKGLGFNINYKWIEGFIFEGSPQFTGYVPSYSLLDVQINKKIPKYNLTAKLGASNVLNNKVLQVYGGPFVGRMLYFSLLFDWENK